MEQNQRKEKFEGKITRTVSEILLLKEEGKSETEEFNSLRTKLADLIWRWAECVFKKNELENAGEEIMKCVNWSVKSFDGSPEKYMSYIFVSLKKEIQRANEKLSILKASAIDIPEKKRRLIHQMSRWAEQCGKDISDSDVQKKLASIFGVKEGEIAELLTIKKRALTVGEFSPDDCGNEISLFDSAFVSVKNGCGNIDFDFFESSERMNEMLDLINSTFLKSQERTRPYLSALVTRQFLEEIKSSLGVEDSVGLILKMDFAGSDGARKIIEMFRADSLPTQEKVAGWFKKDKTDASRTLGGFLRKMEKQDLENRAGCRKSLRKKCGIKL